MQAFWDITRRELGDAKAEARVKDRELEEAQVRVVKSGLVGVVAWCMPCVAK